MPAVVNVLGLRHSGTTMLHLMLATGDRAIACGEISGWFRLSRYRKGSTPPDAFAPLAHVRESEFHAKVLDHYSADYVIDSSKSINWVLDVNRWADEHGLDAYNILIWKDPIRQAYSNWKRGQEWRRHYLKYHEQLLRSGLEFVSVSYEQLANRPAATLEMICRHIGMPYFVGKEQFWKEDHHFVGSSGGVRRQQERGTSRIAVEAYPPGFLDTVREIEALRIRDGRLANVLRLLNERDVSAFETGFPRPHRYRVSAWHFFERYVAKHPRRYVLRFRWNFLVPKILRPISGLRQRLGLSRQRRRNKSHDPDAVHTKD